MNSASEITVVRCAPRDRFTSISNGILQNENLSCEALAIFVHLLSRPDNWKVLIAHLSKHHRIGRDRVYRALGELRSAGFARLHTPRDPETGRVGKRYWIISEEGFTEDRFPENQESGDEPGKNSKKADGSPVSWNHRKPVNPGRLQKNYYLQKKDHLPLPPTGEREGEDLPSGKIKASASGEEPEAFGRFQAAWRWGKGESLRAARSAFHRLSESERESAIQGVPAFANAMAGRQHPPHASTYLAERKWTFQARNASTASACARPMGSFKGGVGALLADSYFGPCGGAPGADGNIIDLEAARPKSAKPAGALSVPPLDRDRRVVLHPSSEQLAAWHAYERREHGRARLGLTRPAEWPPGVGFAELAADRSSRAAGGNAK